MFIRRFSSQTFASAFIPRQPSTCAIGIYGRLNDRQFANIIPFDDVTFKGVKDGISSLLCRSAIHHPDHHIIMFVYQPDLHLLTPQTLFYDHEISVHSVTRHFFRHYRVVNLCFSEIDLEPRPFEIVIASDPTQSYYTSSIDNHTPHYVHNLLNQQP